jgi:uncharacterized protein (DUF2126 family)
LAKWKEPYEKKLIRWGTELHDKFYYLIFAYLDMIDVVNDLKILDITLIFLGLIHF